MDASAVSALLAELFVTIQSLSGYAPPERHPPVRFLPVERMQEMVCKGPCAVKAFYLPDTGVVIDEALDVEQDVKARAVLLHELVHHLQHQSGRFESLDTACRRWQAKEVEAYEIQHKYLKKMGVTRSFIALDTVPITCPEDAGSPSRRRD